MNEDFTDYVLRPGGWQESRPAPMSDGLPHGEHIHISVGRTGLDGQRAFGGTMSTFRALEPGNADRAQRAWACLYVHQSYTQSEELPRVADLLADLMHHCKAEGVDFHDELNVGADFFAQEDGSDEI